MKRLSLIFTVLVMITMSGCAGMTRTQQTTLSGGAIGAGAGALVGSLGSRPLTGAVVGGAAGAITGYFIGEQHHK
jgi:uncharacterized membrane protein